MTDTPPIPSLGRLLGLDIGSKTIGLAMCDATQMIASPMETIRRTKFTQDAQYLLKLIEEHRIVGLIIGYPLNMDGSEGPRCQSTKQFIKNLAKHTDIPAALQDERMSTMAVERTMLEADISRAKRAQNVDKLAATYILQGFLDKI